MAGTDDEEERALARRDEAGVATVDAYEREYMKGDGVVLHRVKERAPWPMTALMALAWLTTLMPVLLGGLGVWVAAAVSLPILFMTFVLFSVLRVTVSQGSVDVQFGLFGPKIPIAAIEAVAVTQRTWTASGGWGIHLGPGGSWVYTMPGAKGRAVRIEWRDAKGRRRTTEVGCKDHHELAKVIEQARRALPGGRASQPAVEGEVLRGQLPAGQREREGEGE